MRVVTGSLHLNNFLFFSGILLGLFVVITCQEYFNKLWKNITVFTLLVTMVTMKEGNHTWPKLALIFYVSIRFQVIKIILIWFMWQLTWFMWHLTPLLKIVLFSAPHYPGWTGFKIEPFSRTTFNVKNNLYCLVFVVWSLSCLLKLCDFSFQAKKGYEEMEKLSQAAQEQAADAEDKYVHVVLC